MLTRQKHMKEFWRWRYNAISHFFATLIRLHERTPSRRMAHFADKVQCCLEHRTPVNANALKGFCESSLNEASRFELCGPGKIIF